MLYRSLPSLFVVLFTTLASAQAPLAFVENRGQWPASVAFKADVPGAAIWFERNSMLIDRFQGNAIRHAHEATSEPATNPTVKHHVVRMRFLNAANDSRSEGIGVQRGSYNFFQGNDPAKWVSGAHAFQAVLQRSLYPGVDLRLRVVDGGLKYDLLIAPQTDVKAIAFTYECTDGIALRDDQLVIGTSIGEIREHIPLAYQEQRGERILVDCHYSLKNGKVSFTLGEFDRDLPLVIDPTLEFATYSGATTDNFGYTAAYDDDGFLFGGSSSFGNGYPTTTGAFQTFWAGGDGQGSIPGTDIAITKFDTTGGFLIWSTMIGGSGDDLPHSLIVNENDEVFVLGTTGSPNFPTTAGAYDPSFNGGTAYTPQGIGVSYPIGADMIVARLSSNGGQLQGSTYLGGTSNDGHNSSAELKMNYADEMRGEVLLAPNGDVILVSCSQSNDFPTTPGAPQPIFGGGSHDGVVVRLNGSLTDLLWSTFIGGSGADASFSGELDVNNELIICGGTASTDLATTAGAFHTAYQGGQADAFVIRYNSTGSAVLNSSYYGSSAYDQAYFSDLDQEGNVFLFGQTLAPATELILNAPYNVPSSGQFIAKLDPTLSALLIGSRFGVGDGTLDISPTAFLVDYCDKLYVCGWGSNIGIGLPLGVSGMAVTPGAFQTTTDGNDFYLAVFEVDMSSISYGTFFGGGTSHEHVDGGTSRFDRRGRVYGAVCAGCGSHDDFPSTPGAWSATNNSSNCNLGVFKFDFDAPLVIAQPGSNGIACANAPVQFLNYSTLGTSFLWDFGDNTATSNAVLPSHIYTAPGTYWVTLSAFNPNACNNDDMDSIQVTVLPEAPQLEAMDDVVICGPTLQLILSCNSFGSASQFHWSSDGSFSDMLNVSAADSTALLEPVVPGTYYVQATTPGSCVAVDQVVVTASLQNATISADVLICADETATISLSGIDPGSTIIWSPIEAIDSGQGTTTVQASPAETQEFTVQVTSPTGCDWNGTSSVIVSPLFGSSVGASVDQTIVLPGTTVQLFATPTSGVSYFWSPSAEVSNPAIANPTAFVTENTTFILTITDGVCTRSDTVTVTVYELNCAEPDIFVPDAFTPNGDGNNDQLFVRGRFISKMEFKVFDRWGELVFETTDQAEGWDAIYKDKPVDPAVFVYWLEVTCGDGQTFFKKGNVTVIR